MFKNYLFLQLNQDNVPKKIDESKSKISKKLKYNDDMTMNFSPPSISCKQYCKTTSVLCVSSGRVHDGFAGRQRFPSSPTVA